MLINRAKTRNQNSKQPRPRPKPPSHATWKPTLFLLRRPYLILECPCPRGEMASWAASSCNDGGQ